MKKKSAGGFKCTMPPDLIIPHGLSTPNRYSPTTLVQDKAYHEIPLISELLQPEGELYPVHTIYNNCSQDQLLEFCTNFYKTVNSDFLVQGNFKHAQFSWEH